MEYPLRASQQGYERGRRAYTAMPLILALTAAGLSLWVFVPRIQDKKFDATARNMNTAGLVASLIGSFVLFLLLRVVLVENEWKFFALMACVVVAIVMFFLANGRVKEQSDQPES